MKIRSKADQSLARKTRALVRDRATLEGASEPSLRAIELLTSELVTNAVVHGPPGGQVEVEVDRQGTDLGVSVSDDSPAVPVVKRPDASATGGRGMMLVDALAARWGVRRHPHDGKSVWFTVRLRDRD